MIGAPRIGRYRWGGSSEALLLFGPDTGPSVIVASPLFEEANRTRAFTVDLLRALAARGIGGVLPDLPGQGESRVPLDRLTLDAIGAGFAAAAAQTREGRRSYVIAIRSGALVAHAAAVDGWWLLSPQSGPELRRELARIGRAAAHPLTASEPHAANDVIEIAGNRIGTDLFAGLSTATPVPPAPTTRTVRLSGDPRPADRHVSGSPLWRRSEPDRDQALTMVLADDIAGWIARCGA